ncbi:MAG: nuclear transport factor 2 family protein [Verrucomicrobiaceae bacterium]|nr:nuclear transport factor 2 family protein [Verrucomicrobiaceae bacterium]
MKACLCSLLLLFGTSLLADESVQLAAVKAADKARIEAMQSGDREKLSEIFSDELRYAHSTGVVDTKASFIDILGSKKTKYLGYDYEEQTFTFPAPGIALMAGRAHVKAEADGKLMDSVLSYLAVWREENGHWRFLAWQSCKLTPSTK